MTVNDKFKKVKVTKLSPDKVVALIEEHNSYILDVRAVKFKTNNLFIKDSIHLPLLEFADGLESIPKDRGIIIIDWAMKQSITASKYLSMRGYNILGVLKGGIERWVSEGRPVGKKQSSGT